MPHLRALVGDLRDACRALRSSRAYASWVVGSLAIGMAVTIAGLALLNAALILPFPEVTEQHRLVRVSVTRNCGRPDCWIPMSSPADVAALRGSLVGLHGLAAYALGEVAAALPARSLRAVLSSENYFDVLGVRPALGRAFHAADAETRADVAVIAHGTWTREFDADPAVIGRPIRVADRFVEIVGVAPAAFMGVDRIRPGGRNPDIWLPIWLADAVLPLTAAERRRQQRDLYFVGRLKDGISAVQIRAQADVAAARLAAARGDGGGRADVRRVWRVDPQHWQFGIIVVMPIPILVLAIACVNAANLMLARGSQRQREMAIRLAIGAGRARIVRLLLIESAILTVVATGLAIPIAWSGLQVARSPVGHDIPIDATVLVLTMLAAAATTIAFGLAPAVRVSAQRPAATLGSAGSRADAAPRQSRMRRLLIAAQMALSLGLLVAGWQLVSTVRAQAVSTGTPAERLLIARFNLRPLDLPAGEAERFYAELVARAARLPDVEAAGLARHTAVWTFGQGAAPGSIAVWLAGDAEHEGRRTIGGYAGGDLFEALGLRLLAGRGFSEADGVSRPQVAVVNQTLAQSLGGAVGTMLRVAPGDGGYDSSIEVRVVGVIEPVLEPRYTPEGPPAPKLYLPSPLAPEPALALYLRTRNRATAAAQPLRELVSRIAPRVPIVELGSLEELNERSYAMPLWLARAAAAIGVVGLLLATAGLYGVSSYVVAMRSREIAIRMALGAMPRVILVMMLAQSMRIAAVGLVAGGGAALAVSRWIQSEYHGIRGFDGTAFAAASALFLIAMLVASGVPGVHASRLDPMENLRDA